jgi:hypothetical protein
MVSDCVEKQSREALAGPVAATRFLGEGPWSKGQCLFAHLSGQSLTGLLWGPKDMLRGAFLGVSG